MRTTRRVFTQAVASTLLLPGLRQTAWAEAGYVLVPVVGRANPSHDIELGTLRRIFLGETLEDADRQRFVPFNHPPETRARAAFDRAVLNMNPMEVGNYWVDQRIRGGARPPRTVPNVALLRQVVARLPGAISYLTLDAVDATVRVLTVDGLGLDAPAYALREKKRAP